MPVPKSDVCVYTPDKLEIATITKEQGEMALIRKFINVSKKISTGNKKEYSALLSIFHGGKMRKLINAVYKHKYGVEPILISKMIHYDTASVERMNKAINQISDIIYDNTTVEVSADGEIAPKFKFQEDIDLYQDVMHTYQTIVSYFNYMLEILHGFNSLSRAQACDKLINLNGKITDTYELMLTAAKKINSIRNRHCSNRLAVVKTACEIMDDFKDMIKIRVLYREAIVKNKIIMLLDNCEVCGEIFPVGQKSTINGQAYGNLDDYQDFICSYLTDKKSIHRNIITVLKHAWDAANKLQKIDPTAPGYASDN
jgi:hypothetical protein